MIVFDWEQESWDVTLSVIVHCWTFVFYERKDDDGGDDDDEKVDQLVV